MIAFLYHWIWLDFWIPVWPNLAASLFLWILAWWKLQAMHRLQKAHLEIHKAHMDWVKDNMTGSSDGQPALPSLPSGEEEP